MKTRRLPMLRFLTALGLLVVLGLPLVGHRQTVYAGVDVASERHVIAGYNEPNTPPNVPVSDALRAALTDPDAVRDGVVNLNQAIYVRFFDRHRTAPPREIIILVPGFASGANSFRPLATQIVTLSGGDIEVWAVDRRSNLLEDLTGVVDAEREGTEAAAEAALDYYIHHPEGAGGYIATHPFGEVSHFMSEWGVDVHVRDLKSIVEHARKLTRARIYLGGHSLGALLVQAFAAYDFGATAGHRLIDGLILLDGTAVPGANAALSDESYLAAVAALRNPHQPGDEPFVSHPLGPLQFQLLEIAALCALINPEGISRLNELAPALVPVPARHRAAFGLIVDDEFQPQPLARFSVGFLQPPSGQPVSSVAEKTTDPAGVNPNGLYTPKSPPPTTEGEAFPYTWAAVKNLKALSPSFVVGPEPSSLEIVARSFLTGDGLGTTRQQANFTEWYSPQRLLFDILKLSELNVKKLSPAVVAAFTARGGNLPSLTENRRVAVPVLALQARQGLFPPTIGSLPFSLYRSSIASPRFIYGMLPSFAHGDLLTGTDPEAFGRTVAQAIVDFVKGEL
jgi:pimeloyl-ACP methyl ester carboxylesterase